MPNTIRRLAVGVLAVVAAAASPARSAASVTILVQEIDAGGNVLPGTANSQTFSGSAAGVATQDFGQLNVVASSNSGTGSTAPSISTGFSFLNSTAILADNPAGIALRITVTDSFSNPPGGLPASINSSIGAANGSSAFTGSLSVSNQTDVLGPGGTSLAGGTPPVATTVSPSGPSSGPQFLNVGSLPPDYQIQQTITIRLTGNGSGVQANQSFSGAVASGTSQPVTPPSSVPAPAGLVLALAGVPALGLRRFFRKAAV